MNKYLPLIMWLFVAIVVFVSVYMLFSFSGKTENLSTAFLSSDSSDINREIAVEVGEYVLYVSDLVLIRAGENAIESWTYDQLLACAAEDAGFENTAMSRFVQERAKQIYLRDLMLQNIYQSILPPTDEEILHYMNSNPELFFVERHYYQIITADSLIADSLHTRLSRGQNFQVTAQNIGDTGIDTQIVSLAPEQVLNTLQTWPAAGMIAGGVQLSGFDCGLPTDTLLPKFLPGSCK